MKNINYLTERRRTVAAAGGVPGGIWGGSDEQGKADRGIPHWELAQASEVLVTDSLRTLVLGSGICFADRGLHMLKGVSDQWKLFAVENS